MFLTTNIQSSFSWAISEKFQEVAMFTKKSTENNKDFLCECQKISQLLVINSRIYTSFFNEVAPKLKHKFIFVSTTKIGKNSTNRHFLKINLHFRTSN